MATRICTLLTLALGMTAASCARVPPEQQLVIDAADALGGRYRISSLKSIEIRGEGESPNVGQNTMPDGDLPVWKITDYARTTDLANARTDMRQVRTAQFQFANSPVQRPHQALDGDVAFNFNAAGKPVRAGAQEARDRRVEMLQHPVVAVNVALAPMSVLSAVTTEGDDDLVEVKTARGETFTLAIARKTKLPSSVRTVASSANLGDVAIVTKAAGYTNVGGVQMPARLTTTIDKYLQFDLRIASSAVDVNTTDPKDPNQSLLAAPDDVRGAPVPGPAPVFVAIEPVAKGIWRIAGSGNHRSVVFEFDDHLVLFEAPLNEARSKMVIDAARKLSPKPLTHVVVSHHHFDHSGGLRVAVAEGLTIITQRANEAFFSDLVARPWTIQPDALARNPKPLVLQLVDDALTLKDGSMEVQLYHLLDNPREGTNLFAYVPRDRILVQADLYDSTWERHLWGQNVLDNLKRRGLTVDRDVPVHGAMEPFADMERNIRTKTGGS